MTEFLIVAGMFLAFANGANDNFKGFATVWGANALGYRAALACASAAAAAGSLVSMLLAEGLTRQFSGKGLVGDEVVANPAFLAAVAASAAATVLGATRVGLPISTTHALIGALLGAGLAAGPVNVGALAAIFLAPLLFSPIASAVLGFVAHAFTWPSLRGRDCLCVVADNAVVPADGTAGAMRNTQTPAAAILASSEECNLLPAQHVRIPINGVLDGVHVLSAVSVCFARSVNDTPKLAALLVAAQGLGNAGPATLAAIAMVAGGALFSRRVAETMSLRLNRFDAPQGLMANLITAVLVLGASALALPVSTTHVSVGAIAGVGARARTVDWAAVRSVLLAWGATLPFAALCAWLTYRSMTGSL